MEQQRILKRVITGFFLSITIIPMIVLAGLNTVFDSQVYNYIFSGIFIVVLALTLYELTSFFFRGKEYNHQKWFSFIYILGLGLLISAPIQFSYIYEGKEFVNTRLIVLMGFASLTLTMIYLVNSVILGLDVSKAATLIIVSIFVTAFFTAVPIITMTMQWNVILMLLLIVIISDTFGYIGGSMIGKTKIVPEISPNKSLEGFLVGFLIGVTVGIIWYFTAINLYFDNSGFDKLTPVNTIPTIILVGLLAPLGDLFFSGLKRQYGIKDFGKTLPGHGGILDRIDSHIFATTIGSILLLTIQI